MRCWPNLAICKFILCIWFNFMTSLGGQSLKKVEGNWKREIINRIQVLFSHFYFYIIVCSRKEEAYLKNVENIHVPSSERGRAPSRALRGSHSANYQRMLENVKPARFFNSPVSIKNVLHLT